MLISKKFTSDLIWNFFSLGILACSGIIINIFIARYYGSSYLGVFNQVFAIYILLSQFAIGGVHFSTLKHISYNQNKPDTITEITISALILGISLSLIVSALTYLFRHSVGDLLESPDVGFGLMLIAPGLIFFSVNKILLNVLNGLNLMIAYAIFQAMRYILILASIVGLCILSYPGKYLSVSITLAEIILSLGMIIYLFYYVLSYKNIYLSKFWILEHISFGLRGFMSGALSELNTRVDVLTIGYFLSDSMVGIYSFAAIIAEGIAQVSIVLRRNIDPLIGEYFSKNNFLEIELYSKKIKKIFPGAIFFASLITILFYPFILRIFIDKTDFQSSFLVLIILMFGVVLNSFYRPFLGILLQGDRPGHHTLLVSILIIVNLLGNVLLIPLLGIYGAAIATAIVYVLEGILIKLFASKYLAISI